MTSRPDPSPDADADVTQAVPLVDDDAPTDPGGIPAVGADASDVGDTGEPYGSGSPLVTPPPVVDPAGDADGPDAADSPDTADAAAEDADGVLGDVPADVSSEVSSDVLGDVPAGVPGDVSGDVSGDGPDVDIDDAPRAGDDQEGSDDLTSPVAVGAAGAAVGAAASSSYQDDDFSYVPPPRPVRSAVRRTGKVRKARLRLLRLEPWSVMKSAFVLSIAIGITFVVATATLWAIVDAAGVFEAIGGLIEDLTESESSSGIDVTDYIGFSRVVGLATVLAVVDVVLLTALATLFAFLYNLSASLLGGFELTLAEDD